MDALRLILLVVGVVVIAAIYVAGRRGRASGPRFAYIRDLLRARRRRGEDIPELDMSAAVRPEDEPDSPAGETAPGGSRGGGAVSSAPLEPGHGAPAPTGEATGGEEPAGEAETPVGLEAGRSAPAHDEPTLGDLEALSGLVAERGPAPPDEAALETVSASGEAKHDAPLDAPVDPHEQLVLAFYILAPRGQAFAGAALREALEQAGFEYGDMQIYHYFADTPERGRRSLISLANALEPGTFDPAAMDEFETPGVTLFTQLPGPLEGREAFERLLEVGRSLAEALGGELCDDRRSVLTPQTISHLRERVEAHRFKLQMTRVGKQRKK